MLHISKEILIHRKFTQLWDLTWTHRAPHNSEHWARRLWSGMYLRIKESSSFAHSGMYPLDNILLTFDLMYLGHDINTSFEHEVGLSFHQWGQCTNPGQSSPTAQQSPDKPSTRNRAGHRLMLTSSYIEPEEDWFCSEPWDVFDFLESYYWLSDMKINSPPHLMVQTTKSWRPSSRPWTAKWRRARVPSETPAVFLYPLLCRLTTCWSWRGVGIHAGVRWWGCRTYIFV